MSRQNDIVCKNKFVKLIIVLRATHFDANVLVIIHKTEPFLVYNLSKDFRRKHSFNG